MLSGETREYQGGNVTKEESELQKDESTKGQLAARIAVCDFFESSSVFQGFVRAGQNITATTNVNWYSPDLTADGLSARRRIL
jgi:hypothetical protein